ncbi:MAG: hypothetical protein H6R18_1351 [Proteobacteria bacterium]|nr:hypothetical protein [Pseudomonadota bacterium]
MTSNSDDPEIAAATTRMTGVSALRKIRKLVDEENANEHLKSRWAPRFIAFTGVLLILLLTYFLLKWF